MPDFIAAVIAGIFTRLGSALITKAMVWIKGREEKAVTDQAIDQKLETFKAAYKAAFDGTKATKDQRVELNRAIRDFVHGASDPGSDA